MSSRTLSTIQIKMEKFQWTDESVKTFTQVYSGNFSGKSLPSIFTYKNYIGKKMAQKIEQFKLDWAVVEEERKGRETLVLAGLSKSDVESVLNFVKDKCNV